MARRQGIRCTGFASDDGVWVRCERVESHKLDERCQPPVYVHKMGGVCPFCGNEHPANGPADPVTAGEPQPPHLWRNIPTALDGSKRVAMWRYNDADGKLAYVIARFDYHDPTLDTIDKVYLPFRPVEGGWVMQRGTPLLYCLPDLVRSPRGSTIVVPEGEKCVDALRKFGLIATCNPNGALNWRDVPDAGQYLADCHVVILPDNDHKGRQHAEQVAADVHPVAASVRIVNLPGLPPKGDVVDWLATVAPRSTVSPRDHLLTLASEVPLWTPEQQEDDAAKMPSDHEDAAARTQGTFGQEGRLRRSAKTIRLADVMPERVAWLWSGYIPLGKVTVLDGDPGLGKSLTTLDLAARVTTGSTMPDGTPGIQGGVVLLSAEDDLADTIRPRLDAAGADLSKVVALDAVTATDPDTGEANERPVYLPGDLPSLKEAITANEAKLVVIDPLMAFLEGDVNAHRDQDVRRALRPLTTLAQETGAAVLIVRHLNKAPGGKAIYRGGGSIGIAGAARSALLIAEHPDDEQRRVLARVKSNLAESVPALAYQVVEHTPGVPRVDWQGATEHTATNLLAVPQDADERSATDECEEWLRDLLNEQGGQMPVKDVQAEARKAGHSEKVLRSARMRCCERPIKVGDFADSKWVWRLKPTKPQSDSSAQVEGIFGRRGTRQPRRRAGCSEDALR
jgi:archaellum biogenesis ATPase FlaH